MTVIDDIIEKYKINVQTGTQIAAAKPTIIPVSPAIDIALNGGIPEGSFNVLTGEEKSGKTLTALWIAANAQAKYDKKLYPKGRNVYFFGIEGRLKPRDLAGIPHLDLTKFHQIVSEQGKILSAEDYLDSADIVIRNDPGCVVIIDSFSSLCTEAEMLATMKDMQRADGPKLLAKFCRKVANVIPINKVILIGITHLMSNVTGYGAKYQEKSGNAIKYQSDNKLRVKKYELLPKNSAKPTGQSVEWSVEFSALGAPGMSATSYITYGIGIDVGKELAKLAIDLGIIKKKGSWYSFEDQTVYTDGKYQGQENIADIINTDKKLQAKLQREIYEICGLKT